MLKNQNITKLLRREILKRNPLYQFVEDLPELEGGCRFERNDQYGFVLYVKEVSFGKLDYLLSLIISTPLGEGEANHNSYACKLQRCFAHLIEKEGGLCEIIVLQDSEINPATVNASIQLVETVGGVIEEAGKEINDLMLKLKSKAKENDNFKDSFEPVNQSLSKTFEKSQAYRSFLADIEERIEKTGDLSCLSEILTKLEDLKNEQ